VWSRLLARRSIAWEKMFDDAEDQTAVSAQRYLEHAGQLAGVREHALTIGAGLQVAEVVTLGEQVYDERLAGRIWTGPADWPNDIWNSATRSGSSPAHRSNWPRSSPGGSG
jgi:hypothetical protein